jgi:glycosyltransferase involved in cell wall biosynthesis
MPDLDELVRRYVSEDWRGDGDMFKLGYDWVINRCEMLNIAMREWGHKHLYNEEELMRIALCAGLDPIKRCKHGQSEITEFRGRETRKGSKLIMEFTIHDRSIVNAPLVSVLLPAYRATYFQQTLQSVLLQTYKNIEIIVCDDSPNKDIEIIVKQAMKSDSRLKYNRNEPPEGGLNNYLKCFSIANGEFVKFLNDDDLLLPNCIERMINVFRQRPFVTLTTSYRKRIDETGNELPDDPATRILSKQDCELDGISCANALILLQNNFIGEPSTVMFRKSDLAWMKPHFMTFGGMVAVGAGDIAMWLNLLSRGNAYYISEPLSFFRIHDEQRQKQPQIRAAVINTMKGLVIHGKRLGLVKSRWVWFIKAKNSDSNHWGKLPVIKMMIQRLYNRIASSKVCYLNKLFVFNN